MSAWASVMVRPPPAHMVPPPLRGRHLRHRDSHALTLLLPHQATQARRFLWAGRLWSQHCTINGIGLQVRPDVFRYDLFLEEYVVRTILVLGFVSLCVNCGDILQLF